MNCPHCAQPVFRKSADGTRLKARTSILVLHKAGGIEINCPSCRGGIVIPVAPVEGALQKAHVPRFVARRS